MTNGPRGWGPNGPNVVDLKDFGRAAEKYRWVAKWVVGGILLVVLAATSYYQVEPYEQGVVLRFGEHVRTVGGGPHLRLPFGIERVYKVPTERQLKEEFGFATVDTRGTRTEYRKTSADQEVSLMLTGDLRIADVEWVVQYRIADPYKYLFRIDSPRETIRAVAEAEMRGVVGDMGFDEVIKTRRRDIEQEVRDRMREILDEYDSGIDVRLVQLQDVLPPPEVQDSFEEVNRALQEMERVINEALRERNRILFRAEGEAKQVIAEAEGMKIERINRAEGDARRFELLLAEYRRAPTVTRQRLYLESMQEILNKGSRVLVIDDRMEGMLPVLNMDGALPQVPRGGGGGGDER